MGWTTGYRSKKEALEAAVGKSEIGESWKMGDDTYTVRDRHDSREGVWFLLDKNGRPMIVFVRCKRYAGEDWGEGGAWPESAGPCESGCPIAWFKRVPLPTVEEAGEDGAKWAADFRARVLRDDAAKKANTRKRKALQVGDVLQLPEGWTPKCPLTVTGIGRRGAVFVKTPDEDRYRLNPKAVAAAAVTRAGAAVGA